jgi:predicted metal-dependent hydrolase
MRSLVVGGQVVSYELVRRPRMRTVRLTVTEAGLRVSCAPRVPLAEVEEVIRAKSRWLRRHTDNLQPAPQPPLADGALLPILGGEVELGLVPSSRSCWSFREEDARLCVQAASPEEVDAVIESWYRTIALARLGQMLVQRAPDVGVEVPRLTIGDARSRWGSCSARGAVRLSWRLVMAPAWVADYVVVHELAHLRELNHSAAFWEIVDSVILRRTEATAWLSQNGGELLRRRP